MERKRTIIEAVIEGLTVFATNLNSDLLFVNPEH